MRVEALLLMGRQARRHASSSGFPARLRSLPAGPALTQRWISRLLCPRAREQRNRKVPAGHWPSRRFQRLPLHATWVAAVLVVVEERLQHLPLHGAVGHVDGGLGRSPDPLALVHSCSVYRDRGRRRRERQTQRRPRPHRVTRRRWSEGLRQRSALQSRSRTAGLRSGAGPPAARRSPPRGRRPSRHPSRPPRPRLPGTAGCRARGSETFMATPSSQGRSEPASVSWKGVVAHRAGALVVELREGRPDPWRVSGCAHLWSRS
ncbi:hypothetical protein SAMN06272771_0640 [Streptomyces sp. Ag82_O1-12]|nr:hypothetical protein SAMN06272771_0640 [Streptomyces sp. Ag82_O1-12]SOD43371.1 hypothetical protein SAMN06272727_0629 [Streptomyces sp. Ag82_G6-1]